MRRATRVLALILGATMTIPLASSSALPAVREVHPRLGLLPDGTPGARTVATVRRLYQTNQVFRGYLQPALARAQERLARGEEVDLLLAAAAWVATGDERFAAAAVQTLGTGEISSTPTASYYSNVWAYALAYDWLYHHLLMTQERRLAIEDRIGTALVVELEELDGNYACVWHGRTQLANNTLVAALALSRHPRREEFQRRALVHFADAMRALDLTEGWPEGPSYWIYNRAFPFALAADCFLTATGQDRIGDADIREVIRQTALWQLYALAPDGTFVRHGDCWNGGLPRGPGLWQPAQDYYARICRDPAVTASADFFRSQCGVAYHPGRYGWSVVLSYDPELPMPPDYDPARPAEFLNAHLPHSRIFGRETLGEAYFIERWGDPRATWISFKAGDLLAHHGHYDQGSFTLHRGVPLVVNSGTYGDYFGEYRLGYFVQTVSKNSLLVHAPGEFSAWCRRGGYFEPITGGQRVVMPTGCGIHAVNDWLRNRTAGMHYEAGDIIAFASSPDSFDFVAADITAAYNSTVYAEPGNPAKVESVVRKLACLHQPQAVVIFDRVLVTNPGYVTRWLLHLPARPESQSERLVSGQPDDGILTSQDRWFTMRLGEEQLHQQVILPEQMEVRKIGGPNHRGWVDLPEGGRNLALPPSEREEPARYGLWRLELVATGPTTEHLFLNLLFPRLEGEDDPEPGRPVAVSCGQPARGVAVGEWVVVFGERGALPAPINYQAPPRTSHHLLVDLPPRSGWRIESREGQQFAFASEDGVLAFRAPAGPISLTERPLRGGRGHQ